MRMMLTVWKGSRMSWREFCSPCCDACSQPTANNSHGENNQVYVDRGKDDNAPDDNYCMIFWLSSQDSFRITHIG